MRRAIASLILVGALMLGSCGEDGDAATTLADELCSDLESATTPIERRVAQKQLMETLGASEDPDSAGFGEVLSAMNKQCPDETNKLLGVDAVDHDVDLTVDGCDENEASGSVTNNGETTVNVSIAVRVVDADETLLDTSSATVRGLEPGQRGEWEAFHSGEGLDATCKGEIDQVTPG